MPMQILLDGSGEALVPTSVRPALAAWPAA
jgi:hypothetical protein